MYSLDLMACTGLTALPESFVQLTGLRDLDIRRCDGLKTKSLPEVLTKDGTELKVKR